MAKATKIQTAGRSAAPSRVSRTKGTCTRCEWQLVETRARVAEAALKHVTTCDGPVLLWAFPKAGKEFDIESVTLQYPPLVLPTGE